MFRTDYYELRSKKIKAPVKMVMLADLHNHVFGNNNEPLLEAIEKYDPDCVCIAGDLLIGNTKEPFMPAQTLVLELSKKYPVFYALGNHEARMRKERNIYGNLYDIYMKPILDAGVRVLINDCKEFEVKGNHFRIYGYDLPLKYFEKFNRYEFSENEIAEALGVCENSETYYHILLAHNPVYFKQYAKWGADLTLSGHLHGGIIRLPILGGVITPQAKLFPRYCAGRYHIGEKQLVVSRGLGTHTVPIRFCNPPELSLIRLIPENNKGI